MEWKRTNTGNMRSNRNGYYFTIIPNHKDGNDTHVLMIQSRNLDSTKYLPLGNHQTIFQALVVVKRLLSIN